MPEPNAQQLPLFPRDGKQGEKGPPVSQPPELTPNVSLASAAGHYRDHLVRKQYSENTVKSFQSDLRLLMRFIGRATPIGQIRTKDLQDFLTYLREGRGVPCSPKSYQRRLTTLKSFFKWLHELEIISKDPARTLIHHPAPTPLPDILFEDEIQRIREQAQALRHDDESPDVRPYLLFTLLLKTGIKKSECTRIELDHIDVSRPDAPVVFIRYENPRYAKKERKLALPADFPEIFDEYCAQYQPETLLFDCTGRNLEYILQGLAEDAGVSKGCSFSMLRMTSAVRDWEAGMEPDLIRKKLGLSEITWRDTGEKVKKLAEPGL